MGIELITGFDIFYSIILFFIILGRAGSKKQKFINEKPYYKFYTRGLIIKVLGGIVFCLTYAFYYVGGDTVNYYKGVNAMLAVFKDNPINYFGMLFRDDDQTTRTLFYRVATFPPNYMLSDPRTYTVIKISSLFALPGLGGFLATTILLSAFIYKWVWNLYEFMVLRYPEAIKAINITILYLPSTIFWGSGIMKDTFTFGATCFAIYGLHEFFINKNRNLSILLQLFFAFYLIIKIKAYIMFALLPGLLIFANFERLRNIKSTFVKLVILPFSIGVIVLITQTLFFDFDDLFGKYSADKIFEEAAVQNADLKRDVYGSNSFDIGSFEPTLQGALSKFFPAVNASLYRPYMWEIGSPTMVFSGIENIILLLISVWVFITNPIKLFKSIKNDPFFIFCLLFTLILGFGVGLSTSNFGALVRYKIPFLPFFAFLVLYNANFFRSDKN